MRLTLRIVASLLIGFGLLIPLAWIYGIANLPVYHSWGLAHGSVATALPALTLAAFVALGWVPWFGRSPDAWRRITAALSVIPLVTLLFVADWSSEAAMFSWGRAAVYVGAFCMLVALCARAEVPSMVPRFLVIPVLIDALMGLTMIYLGGTTALQVVGLELLRNVVPLVVVSAAALVVAKAVVPPRGSDGPSMPANV